MLVYLLHAFFFHDALRCLYQSSWMLVHFLWHRTAPVFWTIKCCMCCIRLPVLLTFIFLQKRTQQESTSKKASSGSTKVTISFYSFFPITFLLVPHGAMLFKLTFIFSHQVPKATTRKNPAPQKVSHFNCFFLCFLWHRTAPHILH